MAAQYDAAIRAAEHEGNPALAAELRANRGLAIAGAGQTQAPSNLHGFMQFQGGTMDFSALGGGDGKNVVRIDPATLKEFGREVAEALRKVGLVAKAG